MPLHLVEELWEVFQLAETENDKEDTNDSDSEESLCVISQCALAGTANKKIVTLQGSVNGRQVLILVDSGSCGSFISQTTMEQLGLSTIQVTPVTVQVADGGRTQITSAVKDLQWECQGNKFTGTFRVFSIPCYDMILGMDWLHECGENVGGLAQEELAVSPGGKTHHAQRHQGQNHQLRSYFQ